MQIAYLAIKTKIGKLKIVGAALQELEEILEFHEVYGRYDIMGIVEVEDYSALKSFIQNKIMIITGLSACEVMVVRD